MKRLSGLDGMFLHLETREAPMHVGSLALLDLPKGYRGDFLKDVKRLYSRRIPLAPVLSRTLLELPLHMANPVWVQAESIDLDAHIRRIVLPKPGTQAQLEDCVGQLHSIPLDRTRPLWSVCIIEGLKSRQVGYYTNIHHAVIDGQAGVELSKAIFDLTPRPRRIARAPDRIVGRRGEHPWPGALIAGALRHDAEQYAKFVRQLPELARKLAALRREAGRSASGGSSRAPRGFGPKTPLNVGISAERGFAGMSVPLAEVQAIAAAHEAKVNDVVLAICSGALRRYLGHHGGVPEESLIAAMPISLREAGNTEFTTQATMVRVALATDIADPVRRLRAIRDATSAAKATSGRGKSLLPMDFPTIGLPWIVHGLASLYGRSGLTNIAPPIANVVVSNVPGPPVPLYFAGARVAQYWPLSIVQHGLGVNITVESYAGTLGFGVTTARDAMRDPRQFARALLAAHEQFMKRL
jgi:diacylglycerol O-acyltransferase / wax synthase